MHAVRAKLKQVILYIQRSPELFRSIIGAITCRIWFRFVSAPTIAVKAYNRH